MMALIGCIALTACDYIEDNTIFKKFSAQGGESVSLDAHQRAIVTTQVYDESGEKRTIYCAEPSPDAFASISRTITGSLERSGGDDSFSAALAQSLATQASDALSARNATIQLLRDGLYRACEGYASGALEEDEYAKITTQYQHIMAALLSIELLSNINRPRRVSYTSPQQDGESGKGETGRDGAVVAGEAQTDMAFRALEHASIEAIATVAQALVERAMNIGASPRIEEVCERNMRQRLLPQAYINFCNKLIFGEITNISETGIDLNTSETGLDLETLMDALRPTDDIPPPDTQITDLTVGKTIPLSFESSEISMTYSFDIAEEGEYEIAVTAVAPHHGDPALILTGTDNAVLGAADDTEGGLDAKTRMILGEGNYELEVFNLEPGKASFELLIDRVDE